MQQPPYHHSWVCHDNSLSCARSAVTQLLQEGITACAARCDVTKKTEVDRLVAYTVQQYGGLDILIANAGEPLPFLSRAGGSIYNGCIQSPLLWEYFILSSPCGSTNPLECHWIALSRALRVILLCVILWAGIVKSADFLEMTESDFDDVINVNLKGVFLVQFQSSTICLVQHCPPSIRAIRFCLIFPIAA
jgi:NAD(P)-dependent dehydrogenase (short-subunit alcohol dehydrogenase family)